MVKRIIGFLWRYIIALISCVYAFTIGIFSAKCRVLLSYICDYFGFGQKVIVAIPKIKQSELVSEQEYIQLRELTVTDGNVSAGELAFVAKLVKRYSPKVIFEIGTFNGRTTLNIAANSLDDAKVYTLDLPREKIESTKLPITSGDKKFIDKDAIGSKFLGVDCQRKIIQLYGDSATFDFSPYYNSIDLVFIDGSHSYEYVLNDSKTAIKLLKHGKGIILWHDYESPAWPGVSEALNELFLLTSDFKGLKYIEGTSLVCLIV